MTSIFRPSKLGRRKYIKITSIFCLSLLRRMKRRGFLAHRNNVGKVRRNNVDFSLTDITSSKVRRNDVELLAIEFTLKKYIDTTRKYIDISFSTYRRNIDIESTSILRTVPVGILKKPLQL